MLWCMFSTLFIRWYREDIERSVPIQWYRECIELFKCSPESLERLHGIWTGFKDWCMLIFIGCWFAKEILYILSKPSIPLSKGHQCLGCFNDIKILETVVMSNFHHPFPPEQIKSFLLHWTRQWSVTLGVAFIMSCYSHCIWHSCTKSDGFQQSHHYYRVIKIWGCFRRWHDHWFG